MKHLWIDNYKGNPDEFIVGRIEEHLVIYIKPKDMVFCKNISVKYQILENILNSPFDRHNIEEKSLPIIKEDHFVTLGCLITTKENCKKILINIKKIKDE